MRTERGGTKRARGRKQTNKQTNKQTRAQADTHKSADRASRSIENSIIFKMSTVASHWREVKSASILESDGQIHLDDMQRKLATAIEVAVESLRARRRIAAKAPASKETLPIETIDISPFLSESVNDETREARQRVADQVRKCWQEMGFLSLVGHGIAHEDMIALKESTLEFLNGMSIAEKLKLNEQWPDELKAMERGQAAVFRGYSPPYVENLALFQGKKGIAPDDCEKFTVGALPDPSFVPPTEFLDEEAAKYYRGTTGENIFPDQYPKFKAAMEKYIAYMQRIAIALMKACALALDLPEDFLVKKVAPGGFVAGTQRILHYPARQNVDPADRIQAHTDGGLLTLLWRPDDMDSEDATQVTGGLEVLHEGKWKRAPQPTYDALTINIADLFAWWSNGRFVSTPHRVSPPCGKQTKERVAFPFFLVPNNDMEISPLIELSNECAPTGNSVTMRYGKWFDIRSKHLGGIDVDLDGIPNVSRPDIYKDIQ